MALTRHSLGWLAALLVILGAVAFSKTAGPGPYGLDASDYVQIARHVARGDGLVTTTSLYHQGLHLPAKSQVHPLWPLALGGTARLVGMERAAAWLPKVFYLVDLALLYLLTRAVALRFDGAAPQKKRETERRVHARCASARTGRSPTPRTS